MQQLWVCQPRALQYHEGHLGNIVHHQFGCNSGLLTAASMSTACYQDRHILQCRIAGCRSAWLRLTHCFPCLHFANGSDAHTEWSSLARLAEWTHLSLSVSLFLSLCCCLHKAISCSMLGYRCLCSFLFTAIPAAHCQTSELPDCDAGCC